MANWPWPDKRARIASAVATWFSPQRWSVNDMIVAISGLVLAVSLFVPWFEATVRLKGSSLNGYLIDPKGTLSGMAVHAYLWAAFALALLQFVVLAVRYFPARRSLRLPGYQQLLVVTSALSCIAVLVAAVMKPSTWTGLQLGEGLYIVVNWTYGAVVALAAAVVSLAVAVSAIRDRVSQ